MRDNPFHSLYQVMTGQIHDQLALGVYGWLTVVLAWVLFWGGLAMAVYVLAIDPSQRTVKHISVFAMRLLPPACGILVRSGNCPGRSLTVSRTG
jgi:hypothetical protein